MRLATADESRRIDELAQERFGLSAEILMESAGALSAREIEISFLPELARRGNEISVVCGPGHNGADGLVVARHLSQVPARKTRKVTVYLVGPEERRTALLRRQLERCQKLGLACVNVRDDRELRFPPGLIVDALFGIGLRRALGSPFAAVVERMNAAGSPVVSLDVPSGLDADRGVVMGGAGPEPEREPEPEPGPGTAVRAQMTITFGLAKPGFFVSDGPRHIGRLKVLPIGFPLSAVREIAMSTSAFTENRLRRWLPRWPADSHKSDHGHALLIAGSDGMRGAGVLGASAAFRVGAGYVTLAAHDEPRSAVRAIPEVLTASADDEKLWREPRWRAVGLGPGLGVSVKTAALLERLRKWPELPAVIDADAFTTLARTMKQPEAEKCPSRWIATPHAGELSRLLDRPSEEIENDRFASARAAAAQLGCHVLLKGFRTVIAEPGGGHAVVILAGNSALAKAGTGDVLTGMITGLLAQGLPTLAAGAVGAYLHGRVADDWVRNGNSRRSLEAGDLRELLPPLLARLRALG